MGGEHERAAAGGAVRAGTGGGAAGGGDGEGAADAGDGERGEWVLEGVARGGERSMLGDGR